MPAAKDPDPEPQFPEHGAPHQWARFTEEELRCFEGLKQYYIRIENKVPAIAEEYAWIDLRKEHPRLKPFPWFI